jgi:hypothetical protein
VFTTTLTLEERIARAQTQLAKAKENRRKAYEKAAKAEKKVERLIAKRPAGKAFSALNDITGTCNAAATRWGR